MSTSHSRAFGTAFFRSHLAVSARDEVLKPDMVVDNAHYIDLAVRLTCQADALVQDVVNRVVSLEEMGEWQSI